VEIYFLCPSKNCKKPRSIHTKKLQGIRSPPSQPGSSPFFTVHVMRSMARGRAKTKKNIYIYIYIYIFIYLFIYTSHLYTQTYTYIYVYMIQGSGPQAPRPDKVWSLPLPAPYGVTLDFWWGKISLVRPASVAPLGVLLGIQDEQANEASLMITNNHAPACYLGHPCTYRTFSALEPPIPKGWVE